MGRKCGGTERSSVEGRKKAEKHETLKQRVASGEARGKRKGEIGKTLRVPGNGWRGMGRKECGV
jgi:hypothetical protein